MRVDLCKCSSNYVYCVCNVNVSKENVENKVLKIVARFMFVLHTRSAYIYIHTVHTVIYHKVVEVHSSNSAQLPTNHFSSPEIQTHVN